MARWVLEGLESEPFAPGEIARLDELHLAATEGRIEAELALGRHAVVVPELDTLVTRHPLRERPRAQLMLALYRCGRQADALEEYREARSVLSDELGLEPGPQLRDLERAILRQDEALELPSTAPHKPGDTPSGGEANRTAGHHRRRGVAVVAVLAATLAAAFGVVLLVKDGGAEQLIEELGAPALLLRAEDSRSQRRAWMPPPPNRVRRGIAVGDACRCGQHLPGRPGEPDRAADDPCRSRPLWDRRGCGRRMGRQLRGRNGVARRSRRQGRSSRQSPSARGRARSRRRAGGVRRQPR